ncbi:MAG TPA: ABC transporter permease, partial [Opitutus sp.]|nr:ABC transporter permease [Opitutus sp.]
MHDLHLAFRFLSKDRSFSLLAVLVLALGIGAVATQFSVVNGMLLRPPAYPHAERLVSISMVDTQRNLSLGGASLPDFVAWRDTQQSFAEFAAYAARLSINVTHQDTPRRYNGVYVTHDFFRTLGVTPALGRDFTADDDREGAAKTIIVSHAVWQTDFGGAADVIGRSVRINGRPGTIVGVMPAGFSFPLNEQVWAPFFAEFPLRPRGDAQVGGGAVLGRLKPHATPAQAAAELTASAQVFAKEWPATNQHLTAVEVRPFTETFFGPQIRQVLFLMLGAVGVVFLIACVNVMNMQFARATRRMRDLAVCSALGASRGRLLRQMLLESLVLALAGGTAGLLFATWATDALLRQARTLRAPPPSWVTFDLDGRVVAVLIAVTVGAAVLSGIVPAWFAARGRPLDMLRDGGRGGPGRRVNVIIRALVVLQIALTAALLIVSSFMVRSIVNQQRIDRGYDTGAVLTARMTLFQADYPSNDALVRFYDRVLTALRSDPQFTHAALTSRFRLAISNTSPCEIEGETYLNEQSRPESAFETISDGYFSALGLRLLEGRD